MTRKTSASKSTNGKVRPKTTGVVSQPSGDTKSTVANPEKTGAIPEEANSKASDKEKSKASATSDRKNGAESDLVETVKRNGEFRQWGKFLGAFLYLRSLAAATARARPSKSF